MRKIMFFSCVGLHLKLSNDRLNMQAGFGNWDSFGVYAVAGKEADHFKLRNESRKCHLLKPCKISQNRFFNNPNKKIRIPVYGILI